MKRQRDIQTSSANIPGWDIVIQSAENAGSKRCLIECVEYSNNSRTFFVFDMDCDSEESILMVGILRGMVGSFGLIHTSPGAALARIAAELNVISPDCSRIRSIAVNVTKRNRLASVASLFFPQPFHIDTEGAIITDKPKSSEIEVPPANINIKEFHYEVKHSESILLFSSHTHSDFELSFFEPIMARLSSKWESMSTLACITEITKECITSNFLPPILLLKRVPV